MVLSVKSYEQIDRMTEEGATRRDNFAGMLKTAVCNGVFVTRRPGVCGYDQIFL